MAPLPVIANTYRVAMEWGNSDYPNWIATNVIHLNKSSSNPAAVAAALEANVAAAMWQVQSTHSTIKNLVITPLDGSSVAFPIATTGGAKWSGNQSNNTPTAQNCNIVKLLTAKRGRSYRGRIFLPWADEQAVDGNLLHTGNASACTAAWVAFHTAMTAAGFNLVVASYKLATVDNVAALACENYTATQRRRNKRVRTTG
jgi:hypothetical protein